MLDIDSKTPRQPGARVTLSGEERREREPAMDAAEHRVFALAVAPWLTPATRAVEIGPGVGRWTVWMAPLVGELVVVDAADAMLERTRARLRTAGLTNVSFVLGAGQDLAPLPSDQFDLVFGRDVVVRLPLDEAAACLSEIARVLRDGGVSVLHHAVNDVRPVCHDALVRLYGRFGLHIDSVWTDRSTTVVTARKPADSVAPRLEQALRTAASAGDPRALEDAAREITDLGRHIADRVTTLAAALSATAPGPERHEVIQQIRRLVRG
jgi:ubiquinone/menaquinone biosynthesis C-methylase UbiE